MEPWVNNWLQHKEIRVRLKETNDCMVVSFAEVWGISYENAHKHMRNQFRRIHRRGVPYSIGERAIELCPKTLMKRGPYSKTNKISLGNFCTRHPEGRYWVFVGSHALAVIDGVVYDHCHRPRRMVRQAYRVYGPKETT